MSGSTSNNNAFKKNVGVLLEAEVIPALSKKQSSEKAISEDCEMIEIESYSLLSDYGHPKLKLAANDMICM